MVNLHHYQMVAVVCFCFDFEPNSVLGKFVRVDRFEERYIEDLKKELQES